MKICNSFANSLFHHSEERSIFQKNIWVNNAFDSEIPTQAFKVIQVLDDRLLKKNCQSINESKGRLIKDSTLGK